MRKLALFLMTGMFLISCKPKTDTTGMIHLSLVHNWEFRQADTGTWMPARVPGTVHTDLLANHRIEDPFYRLNERQLQWIDKIDWEYRTIVKADRNLMQKEHIDLVFAGLDTYAEVYLNEELILQMDNMFRTWRVQCKDHLKLGDNLLRVRFLSPIAEGLKKLQAQGYPLPASNDQSETGGLGDQRVSPFVRKAPYHFGWDWGPRLVTSGIWRPVSLEAWDDTRIRDLYINTKNLDRNQADLEVQFQVLASQGIRLDARIYVDSVQMLEEQISLLPGENTIALPVKIQHPVLWWPNGMGDPKIYRIRVVLGKGEEITGEAEISAGLRNLRLVQDPDPDGSGKSFYFEVNGIPVFARGANYIPNDVFLTNVTPDRYESIIRSAAEANMNMLRIWGGGIYENDLFYDLCDQYGIMVWQDFMFACSMYPGDDAFLESVRREAIDNVKRLRNHPSIVLWCGNNEIETAWAEWDENRGWGWKQQYNSEQRREIWKAYDTLFHRILPGVVAAYDPAVPYWHSSPSAGFGQLAGYDTKSGDMHYWGVWHGLHPFSDFRKYRARFMSEYGFQSFPEFSSVKRYTLPEDYDIESEVMMSHQRSGIGNLRIRQYMEPDYPVPDDFEQFLYVGQLLQADAIKMAIECHRTDMPYCMGTLYWQINDCWPVASWSGIDYYGRWKALHYFAKEAFKPVILVMDEKEDNVRVHIVSDLPETQTAMLVMKLIRFDGQELWTDSLPVEIPARSSAVYFEKEIAGFGTTNTVMVVSLRAGDVHTDSGFHYFVRPKYLKLTNPDISFEVSETESAFEVTLASKALARNVFLTAEGFGGQFSDNFFDILPGDHVKVTFPRSGTLEEFKDHIKVLHLQQTM
ncbi:MAG: glycoside hydrolase family 2 protein [Bacteroidales bacterium]|nr:glycoside hydrolase family 2 protein [Bacteroidales bacterium]